MHLTTRGFIEDDPSKLPQVDAVMVLGAQVNSDGRPSLVLAERLDYGYQIYERGLAPKILVSGDHGQVEYNEVFAMRDYLMEKGVPAEDIFMDHAGFNTYDSMYRAKEIFQIESMIICTQQFHITRAVYIARSLGIDAFGYPAPDLEVYRLQWFRFRESGAKLKAFYDVIIKREPKYLGDPIPITGSGLATE
jgi:vancomycin permeability regulator SanA